MISWWYFDKKQGLIGGGGSWGRYRGMANGKRRFGWVPFLTPLVPQPSHIHPLSGNLLIPVSDWISIKMNFCRIFWWKSILIGWWLGSIGTSFVLYRFSHSNANFFVFSQIIEIFNMLAPPSETIKTSAISIGEKLAVPQVGAGDAYLAMVQRRLKTLQKRLVKIISWLGI